MTEEISCAIAKLARPDEVEHFRVMIDARTRHADLWPLVRRFGSVKALCVEIGVPIAWQSLVGQWVNLKEIPSRNSERQMSAVAAISALTEKSFDEMWPLALRQAILEGRAAQRRDIEFNTAMISLTERARERLILPDPGSVAAEKDMHDVAGPALTNALYELKPRQRKVLELRFGIGESEGEPHTLVETARVLGCCPSRAKQIERKALDNLRKQAAHMPVLRELVDGLI